jgi:hypothetical protein
MPNIDFLGEGAASRQTNSSRGARRDRVWTLLCVKARISQEVLASAVPAGFGYEKCVRDLGTGMWVW